MYAHARDSHGRDTQREGSAENLLQSRPSSSVGRVYFARALIVRRNERVLAVYLSVEHTFLFREDKLFRTLRREVENR